MTNNFAFEVNAEIRVKSTILDGVGSGRDGSGRGKAENKTNSAQLELGLGLSLAIKNAFVYKSYFMSVKLMKHFIGRLNNSAGNEGK